MMMIDMKMMMKQNKMKAMKVSNDEVMIEEPRDEMVK
jgi:hypothetical protein